MLNRIAESEEVIVVDFDRRRAVAVDIEVRADRPFVFRQDVHIYDRGIIRTRNGEDIDIGNVIARPQQAAGCCVFPPDRAYRPYGTAGRCESASPGSDSAWN